LLERVLDTNPLVAKVVSQLEDEGHVLAGDSDQKSLYNYRLGGALLPLLEQLPQHDVAHPESECGKVDAPERLQEPVVPAATADGPQGTSGVEQLEHRTGVVGEAADDGHVHGREVAEPHCPQSTEGLLEWLPRLGPTANLPQRVLDRAPVPKRRHLE